ncbi:MAG: energy-coupling factor ABC transporter ATP-binding protein, partial [Muribaculaceae bacterium]|nr:energy-coupling factor ABC transporter ATP-binding protein [Muribaculaceae bacterium]
RYSYPASEGEEALRGVTFSIGRGEKVALLGLNGAGKSTLLLQTNGLLSPTSGYVEVDGIQLTKKTVAEARRKVGMVFQNADDQLFSPTVYADVAVGPQMMKLPEEEVDRRVREALEAIGASHLIERPTTRLSGGERRMVAIATVLSMEPSILVLDEPTSYLDLRGRITLANLLRKLPHAMLLATHNLDLARDICPRSILLDHGSVVFDGPTADAIPRLVSLSAVR